MTDIKADPLREALKPFLEVAKVMDFYTEDSMPEMTFPRRDCESRYPDEPRCVTLTAQDFAQLAALASAPQPALPEPAGLREALARRIEASLCLIISEASGETSVVRNVLTNGDRATIIAALAAPQPPAQNAAERCATDAAYETSPSFPKERIGSPEWDRAIKAVSQPPAPLGGREELAETIHKARWPADRTMAITPFADEDKNGREYCFRIADAILAATPTAPVSDRAAVIEAHKAFDRMLRKEIIEECAQVVDAVAVVAGNSYSESVGAIMVARRIRALVAKGDAQ